MTSAARPSPERPYVVASVTCDGCSSGFVTTRRPGDPVPPTTLAGEWAGRSGWNRATRYATGWRCPRCRARYGDSGSPRRFTVREVIARHRSRTGPRR